MYAQGQGQPKPPSSRIALFQKRPDQQGQHVLTFVVNLTPETLMQIYQAAQATGFAVNQYGQLSGVTLGGSIYQNDNSLSGSVYVRQPQQQLPTLPVPVAPVYQQPQQFAPQQDHQSVSHHYQQFAPQQYQQSAPQQYQQSAPQQPASPVNPNYRGLV